MSRITSLTCITFILSCILLCSCSGKESVAKTEHKGPPRDSAPKVLTPSADGTVVYNNDYASIDASNTSQGYIMVSYSGDCPKVKVQITGPDQVPYTYLLIDRGAYTTFPLSAGNGAYTIQVLEMWKATLTLSPYPRISMSQLKMNSCHSLSQSICILYCRFKDGYQRERTGKECLQRSGSHPGHLSLCHREYLL